jgi:hypothetical protein
VTWTAAPPTWYASSKFARRGFCAHCGTPLSFEYLDGRYMDLTIGSLDGPDTVRPESHFAVESRLAAWHVDDGLPEERLDQHHKLMQRWRAAYGEDVDPGVQATRTG